jgi:CRP/FNR family transcriptional regulator
VDLVVPIQKTQLRSQQRVVRAQLTKHQTALVYEGVLSVDARVGKGQHQILDFLFPGDILSLFLLMAEPTISLRAITKTELLFLDDNTAVQSAWRSKFWELVMKQQQAQLSRAYVHQLMIGHLEGEERVVSFLLSLALRQGNPRSSLVLDLPMSRDDIAEYLAMNRDTLSRIMTRLESIGLIARMNRHAIRIADLSELTRRTPIAAQISAAFGSPVDSRTTFQDEPCGLLNVTTSPEDIASRFAATA